LFPAFRRPGSKQKEMVAIVAASYNTASCAALPLVAWASPHFHLRCATVKTSHTPETLYAIGALDFLCFRPLKKARRPCRAKEKR